MFSKFKNMTYSQIMENCINSDYKIDYILEMVITFIQDKKEKRIHPPYGHDDVFIGSEHMDYESPIGFIYKDEQDIEHHVSNELFDPELVRGLILSEHINDGGKVYLLQLKRGNLVMGTCVITDKELSLMKEKPEAKIKESFLGIDTVDNYIKSCHIREMDSEEFNTLYNLNLIFSGNTHFEYILDLINSYEDDKDLHYILFFDACLGGEGNYECEEISGHSLISQETYELLHNNPDVPLHIEPSSIFSSIEELNSEESTIQDYLDFCSFKLINEMDVENINGLDLVTSGITLLNEIILPTIIKYNKNIKK